MPADMSGQAYYLCHGRSVKNRISDMNNMHDAFYNCKKNVGWKQSIQQFEVNEYANINSIRKLLENGGYKQKPFYEFDINERGKPRHIKSLHITDRVVQRSLCDNVLTKELKNYLIYDNGASVKGKGIDFTRNRLKVHLKKYYRKYGNNGYVLIIDFSKFFNNIPHDKFIDMVSEKIQDDEIKQLMKDIIYPFDMEHENHEDKNGMGIGSQVSQVAGIFYPTPIDNYCKIVRGCKYYGRYMDDTYIIHNDKNVLRELLKEIKVICKDLGILINEKKTHIFKIEKGFTYLKIRWILTDTGKVIMKPCKDTITRERRKLRSFKRKLDRGEMTIYMITEQYRSWRGNIRKFNSYGSVKNIDKLFYELFKTDWRKENERK